jgi:hypothetical protein
MVSRFPFDSGASGPFGGSSSINVYFEFTPNRTMVDRIPHMFAAMLRNLDERSKDLATRMEIYAQDNAPWEDHPDHHPSFRYPNEILRETIRGRAVRSGDQFTITLGYEGDITRRGDGTEYSYGGILEEYTRGGELAAVLPTFEEFEDDIVQLLAGGLLVGYAGARR